MQNHQPNYIIRAKLVDLCIVLDNSKQFSFDLNWFEFSDVCK